MQMILQETLDLILLFLLLIQSLTEMGIMKLTETEMIQMMTKNQRRKIIHMKTLTDYFLIMKMMKDR